MKPSGDYYHNILGYELSLSDMAESAFAMLRDDQAAESDPTACDHNVALPYQGGYACGSCHAEIELRECREVWVNMNNGVVKIDMGNSLSAVLFADNE